MTKLTKLKNIHNLLCSSYDPEHHYNKERIFDEILFIFFSWRTPIKKAEEIFQALYARYPDRDDLFNLTEADWFQVLKSGGKAHDKSRTVVKLMERLKEDFGDAASVETLADRTDEQIHRYLISLPGVKDKSAYCIMLYAMRKPFFPADTHCLRICQRLGIIEGTNRRKQDREKGQEELNRLLAGNFKLCYDLHTTMIMHGRMTCKAKPLCGECVLASDCDYSKASGDR